MHFSSDLFVASREAAPELLVHIDPFGQWPHARLDGVGLIELVILYQQLTNADDPLQLVRDFIALDTGISEGPLVLLLPQALIDRLAVIEPAEQAKVAQVWAGPQAAAELEPELAIAALPGLIDCASQAKQGDCDVLLFT